MVSQMIVIFGLILGAVLFSKEFGVYSLAYGYLVGAIISLLFKLSLLWKRQIPKIKWKLDWQEVKELYIIFIPIALTVAVGQINLAVDNVFASYLKKGLLPMELYKEPSSFSPSNL